MGASITVGGWQLNGVFRAQNGPLISTPGNVNIIGNPRSGQVPPMAAYINTCYENTARRALWLQPLPLPLATQLSPVPAIPAASGLHLAEPTVQFLNIRQRIHPLMDSITVQDIPDSRVNYLRNPRRIFNILNTPNFGSPGTESLGSSLLGSRHPDSSQRCSHRPAHRPDQLLTNRTHGQVCLSLTGLLPSSLTGAIKNRHEPRVQIATEVPSSISSRKSLGIVPL